MATSYLTEAAAQVYLDARLNTEPWDDASSSDRDKSLCMATEIIDRLNYLGTKTDENQTLQFPRNDDTVVPVDIEKACVEIALALLDGIDPDLEHQNLRLIAQGYANVRSTYNHMAHPAHVLAGVPSFRAWTYLQPYLRDPHSIKIVRES